MMKRWISKVMILCLIMVGILQYALAGSLDEWDARNPLSTGNTLNGVAYGDGMYVAVGYYGTIVTSTVGVSITGEG